MIRPLSVFLPTFLIIIFMTVGIVGVPIMLYPAQHLITMAREGGMLELMTAMVLGIAACTGFYMAVRTPNAGWGIYAFFMTMGALREMDAHKEWTAMSILKSRFYSSDTVPLIEKLCGGMVILAIIVMAILALRRARTLLINLWHGDQAVFLGIMGIGMIGAGKLLDSFFRLFPFMAPFGPAMGPYMGYTEECLEWGGAALLLLAPYRGMMAQKRS